MRLGNSAPGGDGRGVGFFLFNKSSSTGNFISASAFSGISTLSFCVESSDFCLSVGSGLGFGGAVSASHESRSPSASLERGIWLPRPLPQAGAGAGLDVAAGFLSAAPHAALFCPGKALEPNLPHAA